MSGQKGSSEAIAEALELTGIKPRQKLLAILLANAGRSNVPRLAQRAGMSYRDTMQDLEKLYLWEIINRSSDDQEVFGWPGR